MELATDLGLDCRPVARVDYLVARSPLARRVVPLTEVQMEPDAKLLAVPGVRGSFLSRRPTHHEARRSDDAVLMATNHAAVDSRRLSEVVGIDDQEPSGVQSPSLSPSLTASDTQSSACSGGGDHSIDHPSHCKA